MTNKLRTRETHLVVQECRKEILIYDLKINKAYCLNKTAAIIRQLCDGTKSAVKISDKLSKKLNTTISEGFVFLAIDEFRRENLLIEPVVSKKKWNELSRREIIKRIDLTTSLTLPSVTSIVAPAAINAQSSINCIPTDERFCVSPQPDIQAFINATSIRQCCEGSFSDISFGIGFDPNACCGVCESQIP